MWNLVLFLFIEYQIVLIIFSIVPELLAPALFNKNCF